MLISGLLREELIRYIRGHSYPIGPIDTGYTFEQRTPELPTCPFPKVVLFDIYGTLFVSGSGDISVEKARQQREKGGLEGGNGQNLPDLRSLRELYPGIEEEALQPRFLHKVEEKHRQMRSFTKCPEVRVEEIWSELFGFEVDDALRFAVAYECAVNPVYPMPALLQVLDSLRKKSIFMGIVSNAQIFTPLLFDALLDRSLESLGFTDTLCAYSYLDRVSKPCIDLFEKVRGALPPGAGPTDVLYIGNDMLNDIAPAAQVGFRTALFAGDTRSLRTREGDPRCRDVGPDWIINSLADIDKIIIQ
jgi:putative hydrolase of the HAD superfamily